MLEVAGLNFPERLLSFENKLEIELGVFAADFLIYNRDRRVVDFGQSCNLNNFDPAQITP